MKIRNLGLIGLLSGFLAVSPIGDGEAENKQVNFPVNIPGTTSVEFYGSPNAPNLFVEFVGPHYEKPGTIRERAKARNEREGREISPCEHWKEINISNRNEYRALNFLVKEGIINSVRLEGVIDDEPLGTKRDVFVRYGLILTQFVGESGCFSEGILREYIRGLGLKYFGSDEASIREGENILLRNTEEFERFRYIPGAPYLIALERDGFRVLPAETRQARDMSVFNNGSIVFTYDVREDSCLELCDWNNGIEVVDFGYHAFGGKKSCGEEYKRMIDREGWPSARDNLHWYNCNHPGEEAGHVIIRTSTYK